MTLSRLRAVLFRSVTAPRINHSKCYSSDSASAGDPPSAPAQKPLFSSRLFNPVATYIVNEQWKKRRPSVTIQEKLEEKKRWGYVTLIYAGRNNTHVHVSMEGKTIGQASCGMLGLKKAARWVLQTDAIGIESSTEARGSSDAGYNTAKLLVEKLGEKIDKNIPMHLKLKGFGPGRYTGLLTI
ncbi:hypothetical protein HDV03_000305 [Kappamyces sp. JEL0829]|nr:hypothetical protein HDV03_000305 [Kappamyces sp. JEL0829]